MNKRTKKVLWHVGRIVLAAALVAYVVSQIRWDDAVRWHEPGSEPMEIVRATDEAYVVRTDEGETQRIPTSEIAKTKYIKIQGIKSLLRQYGVNWGWPLVAIGVMSLQVPLASLRWRRLLRVQNIHITIRESLRLTYIGWFFNNWLPGATGGDFVKAWYLAKETHRKPEAITVVILDRFIGVVALCLLGGMAVVAATGDPRLRVPKLIIAVFLATVFGGLTVFYSRKLRRWLRIDKLMGKLPLGTVAKKVDRAIFVYRYNKAAVLQAIVYSWGTQAVGVIAIWVLGIGVGSTADWYHYFVNMPVVWIGWSVIPVPGGFGVAETLVQELFSQPVLGTATAAEAATMALAMILAWRVVQMIVTLPGGFLYLARRTDVSPTHMMEEMEEAEDEEVSRPEERESDA